MSNLKAIRKFSFSPSSMERVVNCTGSAFLTACVPYDDSPQHPSAVLGTHAHALGEHCLITGDEPSSFVDKVFRYKDKYDDSKNHFKVDYDTAEAVGIYVKQVNDLRKSPQPNNEDLLVEYKFESKLLDTGYSNKAYADVIIKNPSGEYIVIDYKNGQGEVDAENNKQLALYALYIDEDPKFKKVSNVKMAIIQPNTGGFHMSMWVPENFKKFKRQYTRLFKKAVSEAITQYNYVEGDHCTWCEGKPLCPIKQKQADEMLDELASGNELKDLSDEKLCKYIDSQKEVNDFLTKCENYARLKMNKGEKVSGKKVIEASRNYKYWIDEEEAVEVMKKELYLTPQLFNDIKLKTPPAMIAELKKLGYEKEDFKILESLYGLSKKTTEKVVDADAKGDDINTSAEEDFADEIKGK